MATGGNSLAFLRGGPCYSDCREQGRAHGSTAPFQLLSELILSLRPSSASMPPVPGARELVAASPGTEDFVIDEVQRVQELLHKIVPGQPLP